MAGNDRDQQTQLECLQADIQQKRYNAALQRSNELLGMARVPGPEIWALRGKALEGLQRTDEALAAYLSGLGHHPGNARLQLYAGHAHTRAGNADQAAWHFHRALEVSPSLLDAYRGLLNFEAIDPDSRDAARILAVALNEGRSAMDRARACFLLGQISVDAGRDNAGFTFYRRANHIVGRGFSANQRQFLVPANTLAIRRQHFSVPGAASSTHNDCPAIIVAGLPRSGKSLVESLLAQHPALLAGGELAFVRRFVSGLDTSRDIDDIAAELHREAHRDSRGSPLAQRYRDVLTRAGREHNSRLVIDTSPANLRRIGYLSMLHPDVPVIFCRRDPLDLAVSLYFKHFKSGHGYSYSLVGIGRAIARSEQLMDHWLRELPNPMATVQYEDLARDPSGTLTCIDQCLGLSMSGATAADSAAPAPARSEADWRLFTARSIDAHGAIRPDLIGFGARFRRQMQSAMDAYEREMAPAANNA